MQAEDRGVRFSFARAAAHGGLACPRWWGHSGWPLLVSRFLNVLDDAADKHWGHAGEHRKALSPQPARVADRHMLRKTLLARPRELDAGSAQWVVLAGIGYLRHQA